MAKRITIKRRIEMRERRKDDIGVYIWTGTRRRAIGAVPHSPRLAWIYGNAPEIWSTTIEFLPEGVVPYTSLVYKKLLLPRLRAMGVIR